MFDTVIVGAGPAGLSAALILGRCRRHVLICDTGKHRNARAEVLHGYLTRDGIAPTEFLRLGYEQLRPYDTLEFRHIEVVDAARDGNSFSITLADDTRVTSRTLLLTAGIVDELPNIEGIEALYGKSVHHCPYCDGWEVRDAPLAVYGNAESGLQLALELTRWSNDLVLCTDGPAELAEKDLKRLSRVHIGLREEHIARLEGSDGRLERIVFTNGDALPRKAIFIRTQEHQHSNLAQKLGVTLTSRGTARTGEYEETNIPGLFVAGDASRRVQLLIVAAAEGAEAAFAINTALLKEDLA
ncbi:MAG TPA: NAD(P)/FAD-dependent oxidoreductase [Ktedonobacteraceae bacterium]|nr:NAD(P)/FAD-dependent oxidoreductase [Ktedonobacteraceae bacterium]